jgi:hypothetical protein
MKNHVNMVSSNGRFMSLTAEQLQTVINKLTASISKDNKQLIQIQQRLSNNTQTKRNLEEELNTVKYAHLDFSNVPWSELMKVDDGGNTNKQLKLHLRNMMEGKMGIDCSSYNIHTLQSVPQLYINHHDVTPHYKELLVRVLDTLLPHITPQNQGRTKQFTDAKYFRITDPNCGEFGTHSMAYTDKWYILVNGRETGHEFPTTTALVDWITQYLAHGKNDE